ncbi:MAG: hypothetical protein FWD57_00840 [Polyangiaceae bacterium]|nr:hypothetical protein [Polyangiaceae bacterium]
MTVVTIIVVLAVIAIPVASRSLRENRSSGAAQQIALLYQVSRARAIGRGASVLVRYSDGVFQVHEASSGDPTSLIPASSCTTPPDRWSDPAQNVIIDRFSLVGKGPYENVSVEFSDNIADTEGSMAHAVLGDGEVADVCFTPSGTMMYRQDNGAFMIGARTLMIRVVQSTGGVEVGVSRTIFILPNGVARVAARTTVS